MKKQCKVAVIMVAGGNSTRMGTQKPKPYLKLGKKTVFETAIDKFQSAKVDKILCVINKNHEEYFLDISKNLGVEYCFGGETRQESVRNGLKALANDNTEFDYVLIHDAARPFITTDIIENIVSELENGEKAVLPAVKVKDTIKHITEDGYEDGTEDREKLVSAQTPQGFNFDFIHNLHIENQDKSFTDDASLVEILGMKVKLVDGDENNFKITTKEDYERALAKSFQEMDIKKMMSNQTTEQKSTRIGNGFDVHQFEEGNEVIICGIKIPHNKKLKGHSDADVGLHAITDALLGAAGMGDIGEHFSDKDAKWKGYDSEVFLKFTKEEIIKKDGEIINVDLTVICEEPKLKDYKKTMQKNVARILDIEIDRVNIKATTTEKMGFLGRKEGIGALATASILL